MSAVHFYHLTSTPLERALPKLLEKSYAGGYRTIVVAEEEKVEALNSLLWAYDPNSFLPHGSSNDGNEEKQPIFLTHIMPNSGSDKEILCITSGALAQKTEGFNRILDIFDGSHDEMLASARSRWKIYKEQGVALIYHQQTDSGSWQQKIAA